MSWLDRLKTAAQRAAVQAGEGAEKLARTIAERGPGVLGDTAAELLAERDFKRARALAADGLDEPVAREIAGLLTPHLDAQSHFAAPLAALLADAEVELGNLEDADAHYHKAVMLLRDAIYVQAATSSFVTELGCVPDEILAETLTSLANVHLLGGDLEACLRWTDDAIRADRRHLPAYYLRGVAMLEKGVAEEAIIELWLKAQRTVGPGAKETVLGWVNERLPAHAAWFERLAE